MNYVDLVNKLNHIANNEESIEMPGGYMTFNLTIGDEWYEFNCGKIELVEFSEDENLSHKDILEEAYDAVIEKIAELEYARDVLDFAIKEENKQ
jgi:hypothetical protein